MPFEKGDKRINREGRKRGNKTTESLRTVVQSLLEENFEKIKADFAQLKPFERLQMFDRLLKHCLPSMQSVQMDLDINNMSEQQVERIIDELLKNEKNG
jgi:hypothetical protein